jgi:predicted nuclease with TOPRIM domain
MIWIFHIIIFFFFFNQDLKHHIETLKTEQNELNERYNLLNTEKVEQEEQLKGALNEECSSYQAQLEDLNTKLTEVNVQKHILFLSSM